jgi:hypothetical protein
MDAVRPTRDIGRTRVAWGRAEVALQGPVCSRRQPCFQTGATLVPALDAHAAHPEPFTVDDLLPYRGASEPPCQTQALGRRKIMRKARSKEQRPALLADLERRYRESPSSY